MSSSRQSPHPRSQARTRSARWRPGDADVGLLPNRDEPGGDTGRGDDQDGFTEELPLLRRTVRLCTFVLSSHKTEQRFATCTWPRSATTGR